MKSLSGGARKVELCRKKTSDPRGFSGGRGIDTAARAAVNKDEACCVPFGTLYGTQERSKTERGKEGDEEKE